MNTKPETKIIYHEIDFIVPVHRFNIQFSYVTKKGLPFIREFMLRLLHISPMSPTHLGIYFGFSKLELDEAISDLMDKGDLQFSESGQAMLTPQSSAYFVRLGDSPRLSAVLETGATLSFELSSFNCIGKDRTKDRWNSGVKLQVSHETIATSEMLAKKYFQSQFYEILDKGHLGHIRDADAHRPSIYIIKSVSKRGQEPLRLTNYFSIDTEGKPIERDNFEKLDDSSAVHELITNTIFETQKSTNISEVAFAMGDFGDNWTRSIFNANSINGEAFTDSRLAAMLDDSLPTPFVGPIYAAHNWTLVSEKIDNAVKKQTKFKSSLDRNLTWIAPSDGFWGQSIRLGSCLNELISEATTKGKPPYQAYTPRLFLPLHDENDRRTVNQWKYDLGDYYSHAYGLIEGFLDGNIEVILLPGEFVVVCYHVSWKEVLPVTMPVGFVSTDLKLIQKIEKITNQYIDGISSFDKPNNLGALEQISPDTKRKQPKKLTRIEALVKQYKENPQGIRSNPEMREICLSCGSVNSGHAGHGGEGNHICLDCDNEWYAMHCWGCKVNYVDSRDPEIKQCDKCGWWVCASCHSCKQDC